jgi:hypothetical protein
MPMDSKDWQDLASVYRAGAGRARGWSLNSDRQQDAEILDAQADRCDEIARERDGYPLVSHDHPHLHTDPGSGQRLSHRHKHTHNVGKVAHNGHRHERDPFGPLPPLFPPESGPE